MNSLLEISSMEKQNEVSSSVEINRPRVSIVIPCYNHSQFVGGAISSVIDQTFIDYEIIVVDDGSTDNSREVVASFREGVRYIWQENQGLSAARNRGILEARGPLIGLLDSDDLYEQNFVAEMVSVLDKYPDADAAYCVAKTIDLDNNPLPQQIGKVVPPDELFDGLLRGGSFPPSCLFARRYCYEQPGFLFDESLNRVADLDLWLKMAKRFKVKGVDKSLLRYRIMPSSLSSNADLILEHRLEILQKHLDCDPTLKYSSDEIRHEIFGRSYIAATIDSLQIQEYAKAYNYFSKAFVLSPNLAADFDVFYDLATGEQPKGYRGDFSTLDIRNISKLLISWLIQMFPSDDIPDELRNKKSVAYANAFLALAILSYGKRDFKSCRRYLMRTLISEPRFLLNSRLMPTLVRSLLPVGLVDWLKHYRPAAGHPKLI